MDITAWLRDLGLEQYAPTFCDNGIEPRVLPDLTADDLRAIGITMVGHRRILLKAIAALREATPQNRGQPPPFPPPQAGEGQGGRRQSGGS
jgi:SAM domain (Sterile alpha motif)